MKLRIIVGELAQEKYIGADSLQTVFRLEKLLIQVGSDTEKIEFEDGSSAFLIGRITGIRTAENMIVPCTNLSQSLKELFRSRSIEKIQKSMEGRFLLLLTGPGEKCQICSDRYGRLDLYYQLLGDSAVFASDLALLPVSNHHHGFDQISLAYVMTVYGYRPPKRHTLYQDVKRLGIGEWVDIDNGNVNIHKISFQPLNTKEYGERDLNEYADLMLDAVQLAGSESGNVVSLSSGWDSTGILACLVHIFGPKKVRAFVGRQLYSTRYGALNQYEVDRAGKVADYFGVHLDVVDLDYRKAGPDLVEKNRSMLKSHSICSHSGISQAIVYDFVNKTCNGDEIVFVGEISDGAHNLGFSQYTSIFHPVISFREYSDKMMCYLYGPTFLSSFQEESFKDDPVYEILRNRITGAIFDAPINGNPVNRRRQLLASFFLRSNRFPLWSLKNCKMLNQDMISEYSEEMESNYLQTPADALTTDTLYAWYLHLYNSFHWQSSLVASRYLMADAYGIKLAMPFWDSRIQDWLSSMPENWGRGLDFNPTKYPLKWMLKNRIDYPLHLQVGPHAYLYDVDPSFSHAAEILYYSGFSSYFKGRLEFMKYRDLLSPRMFDMEYIDSVAGRYLKGIETDGAERNDLFHLCMLSGVGWYGE